jgi:uncharacterized protein involved in exopolysaccharide biosynthesis
MDTRVYPSRERDEIRIKDLVDYLLSYRYRVALFVFGCTVAVGLISFAFRKQYDAAVIISAVTATSEKSFGGGGGGALGGLSSLAALAGMSLGGDSKKAESIATLQSQALTARYIQANNLMPILFADNWDARTGKWNVTDPKKMPTMWKAIQFFKHVRTISTDTKTGLVTLTIRWEDPVLAAKWANGLVKMTNDYEREAAMVEAARNKAYLTQQAATTDNVGIKQAIYNLLQSEISKGMIAQGTEEYAFKVIDPAIVAEKAAFPQKTIWVLAAFFGSQILAVFYAFCRIAWQRG